MRRHEKAPQDSPWSAGLARVNDGSLLFLQHMISKFEVVDPKSQKYGSRAAIVFSGSPLFTGGAGGGESNIRKWIIERDMLEAIVALPEQMFYNTGIGTYIWIVTNNKPGYRKGKIQLVDARDIWMPMGRSQGTSAARSAQARHPLGRIARTNPIRSLRSFGSTASTIRMPSLKSSTMRTSAIPASLSSVLCGYATG